MTDENKEAATTTTTTGASATETTAAETGTTTSTTATAGAGAETTQTTSAAASGADETKKTTTETTEDWREKIIKHDEKAADRLNRFPSVETLWDSYRSLEQKLSSGALKKELPENATPEQLSAWRKDNGVPDKPEDYDLKFDNGLVIGDDDKPIVDQFLKQMHDKNAPAGVTKEALAWYFQNRQEQQTVMSNFQKEAESETIAALKKEWGDDKYIRNCNIVSNFVGNEELFNKINLAVLPDGKHLTSDLEFARFFAAKAFESNPLATVSTGSGMATGTSIQEEINKIEDLMGDHSSRYWKGSESEGMQKRYLELVSAREKTKTK